MPRKPTSAIEANPAVQDLVDDLLEANATYAEIITQVATQWSTRLSRAALSRYRSSKWSPRKLQESLAGKEVQAMLKLLDAKPDLDLRQGGKALIERRLIEALAKNAEGFDRADATEVATLLLRLDRLEQMGQTVQIQKERLELMKQKVRTACSDDVSAEERAVIVTLGGLMPKAKPVSLHPLTFEQAIDVLIRAKPKHQKKLPTKSPSKSAK